MNFMSTLKFVCLSCNLAGFALWLGNIGFNINVLQDMFIIVVSFRCLLDDRPYEFV
jgi:hypothetical protein